jgi:hypothetical protein
VTASLAYTIQPGNKIIFYSFLQIKHTQDLLQAFESRCDHNFAAHLVFSHNPMHDWDGLALDRKSAQWSAWIVLLELHMKITTVQTATTSGSWRELSNTA